MAEAIKCFFMTKLHPQCSPHPTQSHVPSSPKLLQLGQYSSSKLFSGWNQILSTSCSLVGDVCSLVPPKIHTMIKPWGFSWGSTLEYVSSYNPLDSGVDTAFAGFASSGLAL
ncbi:hypothetical protein SLA2020_067890 [Shorea laevis]